MRIKVIKLTGYCNNFQAFFKLYIVMHSMYSRMVLKYCDIVVLLYHPLMIDPIIDKSTQI